MTLEKNLAVSFKAKLISTQLPSNSTPKHLSKNENICPYKDLYANIHSKLFLTAEN